MRWRLLALLLLAAPWTGCVGEGGASHELGGTFTEEASQEQMAELQGEVQQRGGQMALLESFPVQFHAIGLGEQACEEVRTFAQESPYVAEVGECQPASDDTQDGDAPASNET